MAEGPIASNRLTPPSRPIDYYYKMDHKYRGIALIFNHETFFDFQMPIRKGTNVDRDRLEHTFTDLGFDVRVYDNQTETQIKNVLQEGESSTEFNDFFSFSSNIREFQSVFE